MNMTLNELTSLILIVASAVCAGFGTSSALVGASVFCGLIALYRPGR